MATDSWSFPIKPRTSLISAERPLKVHGRMPMPVQIEISISDRLARSDFRCIIYHDLCELGISHQKGHLNSEPDKFHCSKSSLNRSSYSELLCIAFLKLVHSELAWLCQEPYNGIELHVSQSNDMIENSCWLDSRRSASEPVECGASQFSIATYIRWDKYRHDRGCNMQRGPTTLIMYSKL